MTRTVQCPRQVLIIYFCWPYFFFASLHRSAWAARYFVLSDVLLALVCQNWGPLQARSARWPPTSQCSSAAASRRPTSKSARSQPISRRPGPRTDTACSMARRTSALDPLPSPMHVPPPSSSSFTVHARRIGRVLRAQGRVRRRGAGGGRGSKVALCPRSLHVL